MEQTQHALLRKHLHAFLNILNSTRQIFIDANLKHKSANIHQRLFGPKIPKVLTEPNIDKICRENKSQILGAACFPASRFSKSLNSCKNKVKLSL
jgi:hypothetical protein